MDVDATIDDARAALAAALGHPGWFASVYYPGVGGELEGTTSLRRSGYVEGDMCVITSYVRPKSAPFPPPGVNPRSPPRAPALASAAPRSPGFARRNYIRENVQEDCHDVDEDEDEWVDEWEDADPLAAPAGPGGGTRQASRHHAPDDPAPRRKEPEDRRGREAAQEIWRELAAEAAVAKSSVKNDDDDDDPDDTKIDEAPEEEAEEEEEEEEAPKKRPRRTRGTARRTREPEPEPAQGLPPALERLAAGYQVVATMCSLIQSQRVRPTWRLVRSMIPNATGDSPATDAVVTEEDLTRMSALCPGSLALTRRSRIAGASDEDASDPFNEFVRDAKPNANANANDAADREGGNEGDLLLSVTEPGPGRTACDVPARGSSKPPPGEGPVSPPTGLVQGYRTGRTTYGADDDDDDDDGTKRRGRAKTVENGRGDGAVRRRVEAFRRGLGLLVIALADATRDSEDAERARAPGDDRGTKEEKVSARERLATSTTSNDDLWSRVNAAPVRAFLAVAEAERRRNGIAPPLIREETVAVARSTRGGVGAAGGEREGPPAGATASSGSTSTRSWRT